jgi:2,4-dienoyl-CoA reductase-like NADH-dependent reductase (Old Yellow Enzyme family)
MSLLFTPHTFQAPRGPLTVPNRIVIAPMCQYSADHGQATDWHLTHWANLLNSGAGLFIIEATAVSPEGRITPGCLGLWDDATQAALHDKLDRARRQAPPMPVCIQIGHAGRKASSEAPWRGVPRPGHRHPRHRTAWRPRLPDARIPLAHLQPAHRRVWRQL